MNKTGQIGVIGAGSWGTALANHLAGLGLSTRLWAYEAELVEQMTATRENVLFLPGVGLHANLSFTNSLAEAAVGTEILLLVSPTQVMRSVLAQLKPHVAADTLLVSAAKGIENESLLTMSEVLNQVFGAAVAERSAFLSGPSFAREVAQGQPTAVAVASVDSGVAQRVQDLFSSDAFRVYTNDDVMGVEIGGALKNVIALATGVCDGLGFGSNARAALITRGLAEIARLGLAKGAKSATFAGLAGLGDLVLTCTGELSRNRTVGLQLGQGRKLEAILAEMHMVAEGVKTTLSAYQLAQRLNVEMPITTEMYRILYADKEPSAAVADLMLRGLKSELG
ncbi:MAG: NAD(P)H-dependent glycerol-3-phosphate dehydrogenase [Desulfuromonadales bacterium]|nr:NAD(P)H-dependent glycerol-3-phosphate dehydrogenase [Desulfuromonadales bacterium]